MKLLRLFFSPAYLLSSNVLRVELKGRIDQMTGRLAFPGASGISSTSPVALRMIRWRKAM